VGGASRSNQVALRRLAAFALILLAAGAGCGGYEPEPTSTPVAFRCIPSESSANSPFHRASGSVQTTSPGREGAVLTKFAESTFRARFDRSCPASAQGEWADAAGDWVVTILVGSHRDGTAAPELGRITLEHHGEEPALFADASDCPVAYTAFSPDRIAGHVECTGLHWYNDAGVPANRTEATPIPGLAAFSLLLTFEGQP
jgi:hypothetical protein